MTWDECCTFVDVGIESNSDASFKHGIVTWVVKLLARWLNLLADSEPIDDFDEWERRFRKCPDDHRIGGTVVPPHVRRREPL